MNLITPLKVTYSLIHFIVCSTGSLDVKTQAFFEVQAMFVRRKSCPPYSGRYLMYNAELRGGYRMTCIPPIDANTGKRVVPVITLIRVRRIGSRIRNSRGRAQVAAILNLDINSYLYRIPPL